MRKVILILAVVLFTVPAWAAVTINCAQVGTTNDCIVSYINGEAKKVRAFALDITVSSGTITAVDANIADYDPNYNIYPGSNGIKIVEGEVTDYGTAVADPNDHPDTQPGIGYSAITVEMGALYSPPDDANGPPNSGNLLRFTVSTLPCTVTIAENESRGGVVLTDPNLDPTVVAPGCELQPVQECLIGGNADFPPGSGSEKAAWLAWGSPDCWCYCRQCRGDADGKKTGPFWVTLPDLTLLAAGFGKTDAPLALVPNGICADFDHKKTGPFRVTLPDLTILATYFGNVAAPPNCNLAPVITGPYNFWCDPVNGCPGVCP